MAQNCPAKKKRTKDFVAHSDFSKFSSTPYRVFGKKKSSQATLFNVDNS